MSKQDGYASRTAADLERKYNFGQTFAEVYGLVTDARKIAEEAQSAIEGLDQEQIFNLLTNNGKAQGIYRDDNGDVYVNASFIRSGTLADGLIPASVARKSDIADIVADLGYVGETGVTTIVKGVVTTDYVNALGIQVAAANITGQLVIGQLPSSVAKTSDIPTMTSQLTNNSGFVDSNTVTTITNNAIKTAEISANQIKVGTMSGIKLETSEGTWTNIVIDEDTIVFGGYGMLGLGSDGRLGLFADSSYLELAGERIRFYNTGSYFTTGYWTFFDDGLMFVDASGNVTKQITATRV